MRMMDKIQKRLGLRTSNAKNYLIGAHRIGIHSIKCGLNVCNKIHNGKVISKRVRIGFYKTREKLHGIVNPIPCLSLTGNT